MVAGPPPDPLFDRVRAATAGEYVIEGELGRGGMAAVYLGRDVALHRRVAIKVMLPEMARVAGSQERFVVEARTAAQLDHPGIVTIYAVKQSDGLTFIVMKYIEGQTLDHVLATRGPLDSGVVAAIGSHVAQALQFAHSHGVVHRDVKPSNIIIDTTGHPVVADFGIAKVSTSPSLTMAGATLGTPAYMCPEQCLGLPVTPASDQYSLGVVLYQLLTGRVPFSGSLYEVLKAHTSDAPPPIQEIKPEVDPALGAIVTTMLAKKETERLPSMRDVSKALLSVGPRRSQTAEWQAITAAVPPELPEASKATPGGAKAPAPEFASAFIPVSSPADSAVPPTVHGPASVQSRGDGPSLRPDHLKRIVVSAFAAMVLLAAVGYVIGSRDVTTKTAPPTPTPLKQAPPTQAARVDSTAPTKPAESVSTQQPEPSLSARMDTVRPTNSEKKLTPPPAQKTGSKADRVGQVRRDSIAGRCAALNLKFSVGEDVTRADSLFLRLECAKQRP
jgi:serine/threonine-protein kinase